MQPNVPEESPTWQFSSDEVNTTSEQAVVPEHDSINWTASEFIVHQKSGGWYVALFVAAALVGAIIYLLTKDIISTVMVAIVAILFGVFAARKPRTLQYGIDPQGLQVGQREYGYQEFKSFSVVDEGAISSIVLVPLKRFMPLISIYFPPDEEENILDVLSLYLPFEERQHDAVDKFMKRIRF